MTKVPYAGQEIRNHAAIKLKARERRVERYHEQTTAVRQLYQLRSWVLGTHGLDRRAVVDKIDDMLFEITAKRKTAK